VKSNIEWKWWGEVDPFYGVCSVHGKGRRGRSPWTNEEFYGKRNDQDWSDYLKHWEHYGINRKCCVEIGCGVGRMTQRLASYFDAVRAFDVSEKMIECARLACDPNKVTFQITDGFTLALPDDSVSAGFSTIVFQHFDKPEIALLYFSELARVLIPGGTIMINLPVHVWPDMPLLRCMKIVYAAGRIISAAKAGLRRRILLSPLVGTRIGNRLGEHMHSTSYEFAWLRNNLAELGFDNTEVRRFYVATEERHHAFVFARKL
jgi:ubiquinone/menaquinone biosynthesis C-methylase UbiE